MGRKKTKNNQSSDANVGGNVNGDSSDSNEKNVSAVNCTHVAKSVDFNQVVKGLKNTDNFTKNYCSICLKESKGLKGSDLFICLKCGTKTCCKEHSKAHYDVPRSDLHSLAFDYTSKILWCYSCSSEINERDTKLKKLSTCLSSLNRQLSGFKSKKSPGGADVTESNEIINDNENSPSSQNGRKGKHQQQKNKPGNANRSPSSPMPVRGLSNLGNTCYFNSVMQCLARTQLLLAELKEMDHRVDVMIELKGGDTLEGCLEKWDPMSECLHETLTALLAEGSVFVPSKFLGFVRKKHPQFEGYDQHDAHELLRHTLDSIKMNDLKRYQRLILAKTGLSEKVDPKSVPQQLHKQVKELEHKVTQVQTFIPEKTFKGKLVSRVECQECNHSSEYIEGFLDLSLPVLADKPHPPVARRKTGCASDHLYDDKTTHKVSPKQKRAMKRLANDELKRLRKEQGDSNDVVPDEVADDADKVSADRPNGTFGMDEDKPHESGYSSEKASSSLRGSPSSEEVRSSSPCDDSWSTVPQFTESWLSSISGGIQLPPNGIADITPNLVNRPPTHIPLRSDGTPDLANLCLHDSIGSTLNPLCQDTQTIMKHEPGWRNRIYQRYFNPPPASENNELGTKIEDSSGTPDSTALVNHECAPNEAVSEVPVSNEEPVSKENNLDEDTGDSQMANTFSETTESVDVSRSVSPPYRRQLQMRPQVKRSYGFSPVREEETECLAEQALLDSIQETNLEKPDNNLHPQKLSPQKEAIEEWYRTKLEECQPLRDLSSEDTNEANFTADTNLLELVPTRFGCSGFFFGDGNPECDDWSSPHKLLNSSNNGNSDIRDHNHTAPNNSLDSEGNESGNEKSMNTCSEEFTDELLRIVTAECRPDTSKDFNAVQADDQEEHCKGAGESLPDQLPELPEEGDFEPLLDSLPTKSKLSLNCLEVEKKEPELHELCEKLSIIDDGSSLSKPNLPEKLVSDCSNDLNIDLSSLMSKRDNMNKDSSECSVESCLRQFTAIEFMTGNNKVGCSACTERQNKGAKDGKTVLTMATKQLLIGQAPPVLILHLKRFQVQLHSFKKLSKHVSYPLVLDLAPFCTSIGEDKNKVENDKSMPYLLYAIVEHQGTLNSGHYVAYVKTGEGKDRRWFCISDSYVNEVTEERALKTEAYLLFYSRITLPSAP